MAFRRPVTLPAEKGPVGKEGEDNAALISDESEEDNETESMAFRRPVTLPAEKGPVGKEGEDNAAYISDESEEDNETEGSDLSNTGQSASNVHFDDTIEHEGEGEEFDQGEVRADTPSPNWDVFRTAKSNDWSALNIRFWRRVHEGVRVTLCVSFFILMLLTASLSKLLFLLTAFNINTRSAPREDEKNDVTTINMDWVWTMVIIICAPYVFTIFRNMFRVIFSKRVSLQLVPLLVVMLMDTFHSIGLCLFVFVVAPTFNPLVTLMLCQGVGSVPSFSKLFWSRGKYGQTKYTSEELATSTWKYVSFTNFVFMLSFIGLCTWRVYVNNSSITLVALVPISLVLISMRWWDNFVQMSKVDKRQNDERPKEDKNRFFRRPSSMTDLLKMINQNRVKIDLCVSVWKVALTLTVPAVLLAARGDGCSEVFAMKTNIAQGCGVLPGFSNLTLVYPDYDDCGAYFPYLVALVSGLASGIGYKVAKSACKIRAQVGCFSIPLVLTTPVCCVLVLVSYSQPVEVGEYIPCHVSWVHLEETDIFSDVIDLTTRYYFPLVLLGLLAMLLLCVHIWVPSAGRVAATDKLFNRPLYCGVFFDVSLLMNRRPDDSSNIEELDRAKIAQEANLRLGVEGRRIPTQLYICVTMWHETEQEMIQLLKSIFNMDRERSVCVHTHEIKPSLYTDVYDLETHIFFDNAFGNPSEDEDPRLVNSYVRCLVESTRKAAKLVYASIPKLEPPEKIVTPYGGQLIWTLPGGTRLIVHLKDKQKIRIKKRWSQVMYMYYLLSYKLVCRPHGSEEDLKKQARNTFILTLDGDVDFQPSAVQMLLDRMRKSRKVGAACGRIHPIGSGPIVWYQKFEYAMSHWLQKAAEHVIGCVLCSPGCFSMFRASALMDDNVLARYAEVSKEPRHYIQYDQGEDRWLCTLLLQQGHRIEYCAGADAKTYAPEGFKEFFNQRRRWIPSTMANILDVLQTAGTIRNNNSDISLLYIIYQGFLFLSSILTPGTIFLLIFSAINTAYPAMSLHAAMLLNLAPIVVFIIMLFTTKPEHQIAYAELLSILYALVMMIVLVGVFKQIVESSFCSMSAFFFLYIVGVFVISALFHPQEFYNVVHGFLYFMAIPCMSMLLMFYGFGNMNEVSWGTRESQKVPGADVDQNMSTLKKIKSKVKGDPDADSDFVFSFGGLFRCVCCPKPGTSKYERLLDKMEDVEYEIRHMNDDPDDESLPSVRAGHHPDHLPFSRAFQENQVHSNPLFTDQNDRFQGEDDNNTKTWTEDPDLEPSEVEKIGEQEKTFWTELINKRLQPLSPSKKEKDDMANGLTDLRNRVCMFFFLSNCLFVTLMFILESVSEYTPSLVFHLPCDTGSGGATREPVAIAFTLIFGVLLFVQFLCMMMHRYSTLLAIASIADVSLKGQSTDEDEWRQLMEDMYLIPEDMRSEVSAMSNISTKSTRSITSLHEKDLFRRIYKDSTAKQEPDRDRYLIDCLRFNLTRVLDTKDEFKGGETGEIPHVLQKKFSHFKPQSIIKLMDLAKEEEGFAQMEDLAKVKWKDTVKKIRTSKLQTLVEESSDP